MKNFVASHPVVQAGRLYQDAVTSNGDISSKTKRNLVATLHNSTYPVELISQIAEMNVDTAVALKTFDSRLMQNWKDYSQEDKEELLLLTNEQHDIFLRTKGMRASTIEFMDEIPDSNPEKPTLAEYDDVRHVTMVSREILKGSAVEAFSILQHEEDHSIIKQFREQRPELLTQYPALLWSKVTSTHAVDGAKKIYNDLYDHCAEEALVRSAQVNFADILSPGSNAAKSIRADYVEGPGYHRMAASKQFFNFVK